jgi:hypothetical protein
MSNLCRRFRTTLPPRDAKPLIRYAAGAVAEGRQHCLHEHGSDPGVVAVANTTRSGRAHVIVAGVRQALAGCFKRRGFHAAKQGGENAEILVSRGFDNAHCRSFSTLHRHTGLFYTRPTWSAVRCGWTSAARRRWRTGARRGLPQPTSCQRFVMALTVSGRNPSQHNPPIEWWVQAHIRG